MRTVALAEAIGRLSCRLSDWGYVVKEVDDVSTVPGLVDLLGKSYLTPLSSPGHNDFTENNVIWLVAMKGDTPVFAGCARLEDIGRESISRYWSRTLKRAYGANSDAPVIEKVRPEVEKKLFGRLVYFGDLYVNSSERGSRVALRSFVALGHLAVSLKWDPDWIYCFVREEDLARGAGVIYGFSTLLPEPFNWLSPPPPRSNSEWLALLPRDEIWSFAGASLRAALRSAGPRRDRSDNQQGVIKDAPAECVGSHGE
ncbi:hypothetical protein PhaeoP88_01987 [Phaeobacter inhibens]|uniref:Uncharacterized protein n=1 Tax=Phaeobacter inhibens TaxID=221822 RepID=A0A2I7K9T5_9RHOB|nr:hypothetical protein PhaeoP88_01987 [Phaeobacter inhibens]